jgi:transforming growth factor-beta-induced protein
MASNGVIHVIDKVVTPPSVVDLALNDDRFESLVAALVKEELVETLSGTGPFTVFAPTDDAFATLLTSLGASNLDDPKVPELTPILLYHVASGNKRASNVTMQTSIASLNASARPIAVAVNTDGAFLDTDSKIIITDVQGTNGVIHVINKVLLPTEETLMMAK